jgi:hypothetical protein
MAIEYIDTIHLRDLHLHGDWVAKDPKHPGNKVNGAWEGEIVAKIRLGDARTSSLSLDRCSFTSSQSTTNSPRCWLVACRCADPKSPSSPRRRFAAPRCPELPLNRPTRCPSICCSPLCRVAPKLPTLLWSRFAVPRCTELPPNRPARCAVALLLPVVPQIDLDYRCRVDGLWGEREPNIGYEKADASARSCDRLPIGVQI